MQKLGIIVNFTKYYQEVTYLKIFARDAQKSMRMHFFLHVNMQASSFLTPGHAGVTVSTSLYQHIFLKNSLHLLTKLSTLYKISLYVIDCVTTEWAEFLNESIYISIYVTKQLYVRVCSDQASASTLASMLGRTSFVTVRFIPMLALMFENGCHCHSKMSTLTLGLNRTLILPQRCRRYKP